MQIWEQGQHFWQNIMLSNVITNEEKQIRIRFLLSILPIIIVILAIMLISRIIFVSGTTWRSYMIFSSSIGAVSIIYLVVKSNRYDPAIFITFLVSCSLILLNAVTAQSPYYEISYLLLLPLIAVLLLSLRETIIWVVFTFIAFIIFGVLFIFPDSASAFSDLVQQSLIFNLFILVLGYQRNRLESDRQQLLVEKERNDLLQYLLNIISHDFKTPLSIINSGIYLLQRSLDDDKQLERLGKITQQTNHLDKMVNDILNLSRLEYDVADSVSFLDLSQIITQTVENLKPLADSKNIAVHTEFSAVSCQILASYQGLNHITVNLLGNAIKYTADNGNISLRLYNKQKRILFEIEDTGIGMTEDELSRIFDPFYRADRTRSIPGNGLGLSLVKKTVQLFDGTIEASSTLNRGTCFRVSFPSEGCA